LSVAIFSLEQPLKTPLKKHEMNMLVLPLLFGIGPKLLLQRSHNINGSNTRQVRHCGQW
jgi:hypothetical protein